MCVASFVLFYVCLFVLLCFLFNIVSMICGSVLCVDAVLLLLLLLLLVVVVVVVVVVVIVVVVVVVSVVVVLAKYTTITTN